MATTRYNLGQEVYVIVEQRYVFVGSIREIRIDEQGISYNVYHSWSSGGKRLSWIGEDALSLDKEECFSRVKKWHDERQAAADKAFNTSIEHEMRALKELSRE